MFRILASTGVRSSRVHRKQDVTNTIITTCRCRLNNTINNNLPLNQLFSSTIPRSISTTSSLVVGRKEGTSSFSTIRSTRILNDINYTRICYFSSFPSNLKIDPRSSFASILQDGVEGYDDDDDRIEFGEEGDNATNSNEVQYVIPLPDRLHVNIYNFDDSGSSSSSTAIDTPAKETEEGEEINSEDAAALTTTTTATSSTVDTKEIVGTIHLDDTVFGNDPIRVDLLKRAVDYIRAKIRGKRTARTKTISEVSGSGRKVRQQKGGGIARAGHSRPPHWRGGAKAHGPKGTIQDYGSIKLNKKMKKLALRNALSQKLKEGNLIVVNQFYTLPTHKTKNLTQILAPFLNANTDAISNDKLATSALLLDNYYPEEDEDEGQPKATSFRGVPINLWVASANIYKVKVGNDLQANVYDILKYQKLILTVSAMQAIEKRLRV